MSCRGQRGFASSIVDMVIPFGSSRSSRFFITLLNSYEFFYTKWHKGNTPVTKYPPQLTL